MLFVFLIGVAMFGLRVAKKKKKGVKKASLARKVVQGSELFLAYPFRTPLSFMFLYVIYHKVAFECVPASKSKSYS